MGPVEIAVIEFPGNRFNGEIVPALAELVDRKVVSILDLVIVSKDADGDVVIVELSKAEELADHFAEVDGEVMGLLSQEDIELAGASLQSGTTAAVIVWENTWARGLTQVIGDQGGRLVAHERLDAEAVALSMAEARKG